MMYILHNVKQNGQITMLVQCDAIRFDLFQYDEMRFFPIQYGDSYFVLAKLHLIQYDT